MDLQEVMKYLHRGLSLDEDKVDMGEGHEPSHDVDTLCPDLGRRTKIGFVEVQWIECFFDLSPYPSAELRLERLITAVAAYGHEHRYKVSDVTRAEQDNNCHAVACLVLLKEERQYVFDLSVQDTAEIVVWKNLVMAD